MSKGSKSRISDKKSFDNNWDAIFRKKKKKSSVIKVEKGKQGVYGHVTRYHYEEVIGDNSKTRNLTPVKSSHEKRLEG